MAKNAILTAALSETGRLVGMTIPTFISEIGPGTGLGEFGMTISPFISEVVSGTGMDEVGMTISRNFLSRTLAAILRIRETPGQFHVELELGRHHAGNTRQLAFLMNAGIGN